jgi:soluble cytochrome b562
MICRLTVAHPLKRRHTLKTEQKLKLLVKADRRKQWKLLKAKHAKAIQASGIDFDSGFGKQLDKYQAQVDKVSKLAASGKLNRGGQLDALKQAATPLVTTTRKYHDKVKESKTLAAPAKKELSVLLKAVAADIKSWDEVADAVGLGRNTYQYAFDIAQVIEQILEGKEQPVALIVERAERLTGHFQGIVAANTLPPPYVADQNQKDDRLQAERFAALASRLDQAARLFSPALVEVLGLTRQVKDGKNFGIFMARSTAMEKLLARLVKTSQAFHDAWEGPHPPDNDSGDGWALHDNHAELDQHVDIVGLRVKEMRETQD